MTGSLSGFLHSVRSRPLLDAGQEIDLAKRAAAGADEAFRDLVVSNLPWVIRIAREYRDLGVPFEDLLHEGILGLLHAVRRFDPERGNRLLTYASPWIRKTILQALDRQVMIRVSRDHARRHREADGSRRPTTRPRVVGLDDRGKRENSRPLADLLADDGALHGETEMLRAEAARRVRDALARLAPRERRIVVWRHGLDDTRRLSLETIGGRLGLSRERVRQIELRALEKMRKEFRGSGRARPQSRPPAGRGGPASQRPLRSSAMSPSPRAS